MITGKRGLAVRTAIMTATVLLGLAPVVAAHEPADDDPAPTPVFHHIGTVTEPAIFALAAGITPTNPTGKFASFDISWVDNERNVYYLADRSNNAIDVIDTTDGSFTKFLAKGQFAGIITGPPNRNGPDGVVTDKAGNVWVGDGLIGGVGSSSLKGFDPDTGLALPGTPINLGGKGRADELAYAHVGGGRILIANPSEPDVAFASLVNTSTKTVIGKVRYDEGPHAGLPAPGHGFNTVFGTPPTQHGLEQPVFFNGKFYLNVPATIQNPGGELDVFDTNEARITAVLPLTNCEGTGLTVARDELVVECGDSARIVDADGNVEATFPDLGGTDEIWFNPGDGNVYIPSPGKGLAVLDFTHSRSLGVTLVPGTQGVHSVAAAAHGNRIFMPISDNPDNGAGGIAMFHQARQKHVSED